MVRIRVPQSCLVTRRSSCSVNRSRTWFRNAFADGIENAKPQQAFTIRTQRPRPLLSQHRSFGLIRAQMAVAIGDDT